MIRLGPSSNSTKFPELTWIWHLGPGPTVEMSNVERDEYAEDADCVQWFRALADMERWQEEVEILTQESRRIPEDEGCLVCTQLSIPG